MFGVDDPRSRGRRCSTLPTRSTACACGTPYDYAAAYVGHLGDYRCPTCGHARPPSTWPRARSSCTVSTAPRSRSPPPKGRRASSSRCRASTTSTTHSPRRSLASTLGAPLGEVAAGLGRFSAAFGRFERIPIGDRRLLMLLIKNPAGANEIVRTLRRCGAARVAVVALNDEIADGRDVSWIWDVDFEPLLAGLETLVATGARAEEAGVAIRLRRPAARSHRGRDLARGGARPRARAHAARRRARRSSRLTPRCSRCVGLVASRGHVANYWEAAA